MAKRKSTASPARSDSGRSTRLLLWIGVVYASVSLGHLLLQEYRLLYQGRVLRAESISTDEKSRELRAAIEYAKSPEGVERLARKNLGMARPGEQPIRFVPDTNHAL
ncbi:MAG TPA: septum formation initiator family protein [Stenomitos sp.]